MKIVEIGTLCGYSGIFSKCLVTRWQTFILVNKSQYHIQVARAFQQLQLEDKIDIIEGKALDTLPKIKEKGPFDLILSMLIS